MPGFPSSGSSRIDPDCFTEGEQMLFQKIMELAEKHGSNLTPELLDQEWPYISKAFGVLRWRALDIFQTYMSVGDPIKDWFFKLHLTNFLCEINLVYKNLDRWTEEDKQDFLKNVDLSKIFIFPWLRKKDDFLKPADSGSEEIVSDDSENEHYDRV